VRDVELVSVAAVSDNLAIGRDGEIPWESLPEDRRQYRERVADSPVILGRRTFESMRDDLPGRVQVVVSREERSYEESSARPVTGVEEALAAVAETGAETAYVLGGAAIYELFLPHVDRMVLSRVPGEYEADAFYPEWDESEWERVSETPYENFTLQEWVRRDGG